MTEYEGGLPVEVAFPPEEARSLAQAFSEAGWRQFHVAETEKYAHVTYFFNGGVEPPYPGEERRLIPSPKVATYDLEPAMSAVGVTDALVEAIGSGPLRLHRRELRQPGHGRPHRRLGRDDRRAGRRRRAASAGSSRRSRPSTPTTRRRPARSWRSPPTTATPTSCATRDGHPVTAHSLNPVPFVLVGRAARGLQPRATASSPTSRRRCSSFAGLPALGGDDRPVADLVIASVAEAFKRSPDAVDPLLAIGQILVSIALIIAILLQARGVGLSGTFGGDSAVYRSRRGVERRLWQFTIILLVLFIVFSLAAFILAPAAAA